jgi:hypothetical protein
MRKTILALLSVVLALGAAAATAAADPGATPDVRLLATWPEAAN